MRHHLGLEGREGSSGGGSQGRKGGKRRERIVLVAVGSGRQRSQGVSEMVGSRRRLGLQLVLYELLIEFEPSYHVIQERHLFSIRKNKKIVKIIKRFQKVIKISQETSYIICCL
jgi:hypothetical protein